MRGLVAVAVVGLGAAGGALAQSPTAPVAMIFFDWGKTEIARDYWGALDQVAGAYASAPAPIRVEGHSDRSGSTGGNLESSRRRAEVVRDYLVDHGVPRAAIRVTAVGEQAPYIATADGVREPQNRRVDVRLTAANAD